MEDFCIVIKTQVIVIILVFMMAQDIQFYQLEKYLNRNWLKHRLDKLVSSKIGICASHINQPYS